MTDSVVVVKRGGASARAALELVPSAAPAAAPLPRPPSPPAALPKAPPQPQLVDGYSASASGRWYSLPGGFRLPAKLFLTLFPYQRLGVAWMWSLHAQAPLAPGSLGREGAATTLDVPALDDAEEDSSGSERPRGHGPAAPALRLPSGAILADDMGLGKTLQVVAFVAGLFNSERAEAVLVVMPVSLVAVWQTEFRRFAPNVRVSVLHDLASVAARERMVRTCVREGGVVLTTYGMLTSKPHVFGVEASAFDAAGSTEVSEEDGDDSEYEREVGDNDDENAGPGGVKGAAAAPAAALHKKAGAALKAKQVAAKRRKAAPQPAPVAVEWDLLVLDEGHRIKNPSTQAARVLRAVPSRYRLLLSGTPLQNKMDELWSVFDWTHRGQLLDTRRRFNKDIGDRIVLARDKKATGLQRRDGALALAQLAALIGPYLLRREKERLLTMRAPDRAEANEVDVDTGTVAGADGANAAAEGLAVGLGLLALGAAAQPATGVRSTGMGVMGLKKEVVLWAGLAAVQLLLYEGFLSGSVIKRALLGHDNSSIFRAIHILKKISSHPQLLGRRARSLAQQVTDEAPCDSGGGGVCSSFRAAEAEAVAEEDDEADESWDATRLPPAPELVASSGKLRLFVLLLRLLAREGRKTLVFSQSTRVLDILQACTRSLFAAGLAGANDAGGAGDEGGPAAAFASDVTSTGLRMCRIDGSLKQAERAAAVARYNESAAVAVCFLTTGVGSLGLTLTSATAVIIFDVSWNPAVDAQAVDRAYRMGQTRDVITYRLISAGTVEEKMYRQQIFKNGLTTTVMGNQQGQGGATPAKGASAGAGTGADTALRSTLLSAVPQPGPGPRGPENLSAVRLMTATDLHDLLRLGPTDRALTQRMVDAIVAPPPVRSNETRRHLDKLRQPPIAEACVGLSHHDHLFRLAPEDAEQLQRQINAEVRAAEKERHRSGGGGGGTDGSRGGESPSHARLLSEPSCRRQLVEAEAESDETGEGVSEGEEGEDAETDLDLEANAGTAADEIVDVYADDASVSPAQRETYELTTLLGSPGAAPAAPGPASTPTPASPVVAGFSPSSMGGRGARSLGTKRRSMGLLYDLTRGDGDGDDDVGGDAVGADEEEAEAAALAEAAAGAMAGALRRSLSGDDSAQRGTRRQRRRERAERALRCALAQAHADAGAASLSGPDWELRQLRAMHAAHALGLLAAL